MTYRKLILRTADKYVKKILGGSRMSELWNLLPEGILVSLVGD